MRQRDRRLVLRPEIYRLRPWYHDFSPLGLRTDFESGLVGRARRLATAAKERLGAGSGIEKGSRHPLLSALRPGLPSHRINQPVKEEALEPLIDRALSEARQVRTGGVERPVTCLDLFCADGYYSCKLALQALDTEVIGVDLDQGEIERARAAAHALGISNARFEIGDVLEACPGSGFDLVLCLGGLYHLEDPMALLRRTRDFGASHLVVQSVTSASNHEPEYFVRPAPGWRHGCRFSHGRLEGWLREAGWRVLEEHRGDLPGNRQASDRGSSYFLCRLESEAVR